MNLAKNIKWYFVDQYMLYGGGGGGKGGGINPITTIITVVAVVAAPEFMPLLLPELTAVESAAIVGGVTSAANKAVTGGNLEDTLKAGAIGAASGAVGAEVGSAIGGETGIDLPADQAGPVREASGVAGMTDSGAAGRIAGGTTGGASSAFTRSQLSGQNLEQSLRAAEIGAATGLATSGIGELLSDAATPSEVRTAKALSGSLLAPTIASLFTPEPTAKTPTRTTRQTTAGGLPTTGTRSVGGGGGGTRTTPAVGSAALGQALGVGGAQSGTGSTGGYGAGGESLSPETGGKQQTVWNIESLRVKPEEA